MAIPSTSRAFLELVQKSAVVSQDRVRASLQGAGEIPDDPRTLAQFFIRDGLLTTYQAKQILKGRYKGFTFGKFRVLEQLGEGGTAGVYLCAHLLLRRLMAVKVLPAAKTKEPAYLERFYREARAVTALEHPNVVRAHDVNAESGIHFITMEFVDGSSLQEIVTKHGPLSVDRACHYVRQAAVGLQYLYEQGLVHRDVKPGNLLLDRSGTVKIIDLGLGRFAADDKDPITRQFDAHAILGTADYLSPEQGRNSHEVDIRADVYSLGATLYFLLSGQPPFDGGSITQKLLHHQMSEPKSVRELRPHVPEELSLLVGKMMAKDPSARHQTPQEVVDALASWTQTPIALPSEKEMPEYSLAARSPQAFESIEPLATGLSGSHVVKPSGGTSRHARPKSHPAVAVASASNLPMAIYDDPLPPEPVKDHRPDRPSRSLQRVTVSASGAAPAVCDQALPSRSEQVTLRADRSTVVDLPPVDADDVPAARVRPRWPFFAAACLAACGLGSGVWWTTTNWPRAANFSTAEGRGPINPNSREAYEGTLGRPPRAGLAMNIPPGESRVHDKHGQPVQRVVLMPDQRHVISCGDNRQARIWEPDTGRDVLTLNGHAGPVASAAVSPDQRFIVTASADKTLVVWDRQSGQERKRLSGHEGKVLGVAVASDNVSAVSCSEDRTLRFWNVHTGASLVTYVGHEGPVNSVAIEAETSRVLSASSDETVRLWDYRRPHEIKRFVGHTSPVLYAVFSPDGKSIASCGLDAVIRLWDVESGKETRKLLGHVGGVRSVAFAPGGDRLVSAGQDNTVRVWDVETGHELFRLRGHARTVTSAVFLGDGKYVASSGQDNAVRVWGLPEAKGRTWALGQDGPPLAPSDASAGEIAHLVDSLGAVECAAPLATRRHALVATAPEGNSSHEIKLVDLAQRSVVAALAGHQDRITALAVAPDDRLAVSGSRDKSIRLWNLATGLPLDRWEGHADTVRSLAFTPDGKFVLSSADDGSVRLWDVAGGKEIRSFEGHVGSVHAVAVASDGTTALTGGEDKALILWDVKTGKVVRRWHGHAEAVTCVAFAPKGPLIASAGKDSSIRTWNRDSGQAVRNWDGHTDGTRCLAFSPDGQLLLSGGSGGSSKRSGQPRDNAVRLWDVNGGRLLRRLDGHEDVVTGVFFTKESGTVASASLDRSLRLWRLPRPRPRDGESVKLEGHALNVECVAFGPDNRHVLSGGHDRTVRLWDLDSGKCVRVFDGHLAMVHCVTFAPDGKQALSGGADHSVRLWDVDTGRELFVLQGHVKPVMGVALAPDGNLAASVSQDQTLRLWDIRAGKLVRTIETHKGVAWCVAFTAAGRQVVTAGHDNAIRIWDVASGDQVMQFDTLTPVHALAVSNRGKRILSGGRDNAVRLWDAETGKEMGSLRGHQNLVTSVAFAPDESRALSASDDKTVRLWDLVSGRELRVFAEHTAQVWSTCFSPDGKLALTGSADRTVRLWGLPD